MNLFLNNLILAAVESFLKAKFRRNSISRMTERILSRNFIYFFLLNLVSSLFCHGWRKLINEKKKSLSFFHFIPIVSFSLQNFLNLKKLKETQKFLK